MGTKVVLFPDIPVIVKNQFKTMCPWGAWDPYIPARLYVVPLVSGPAILLGAYQGVSEAASHLIYISHPVAYSGLNGQTHAVDSN